MERCQREWFHTEVETRQGESSSPLLGIPYLERVIHHMKESNYGTRLGGTLVNNLSFADDIDLINEGHKFLRKQLKKTRAISGQTELIMNVGKTKTMVFCGRKVEREPSIRGKNIENVDKFEYLGSLIT